MKCNIRYLVFFLSIFIIHSCSKKPTKPENYSFEGESRPTGPLRIVNSKIKTETRYFLDSNEILEKTDYEYYNSGLIKTKIRRVTRTV